LSKFNNIEQKALLHQFLLFSALSFSQVS